MKIEALRLHNVKRFAGRGVAIEGIGDGVNVLCAVNEFGKSTSFEALHAMFFQSYAGVPKDVKRLQPYAGGNPLVEADIDTQQGRFRLTKQFIGGKRATVTEIASGRLVAQQDEAEQFIADLVRGGTAGPAGLLWVRQGITGLEERGRTEEEGERKVRESLLASVQGEVEAITGGRRMSTVMAACAEELGRIVTPTLRAKAGGPFAAAVDELERLTALEKKLAAEVADLRDALDRRMVATNRLAEIDNADDAAARRAAVEKAEAALREASAYADALNTREAELALSRSQRDAASRDLETFRKAQLEAHTLARDVATARQRRDELRNRRVECQAAIEAASREAKAAETEQREARDLFARLDASLKTRQAAELLDAQRELLARAEAAREALEIAEASLALVAIPPDMVEQLQAIEVEIARRQAAEAAGLPSVRIDYEAGAAHSVLVDGVPLAGGAERSVADRLVMALPGLGTMTLRSNRPAGADAALTRAVEKRRGILASIGVEDVAAAHRRLADARARAGEVEQLRFQVQHLAPAGLPSLRERIARLEALAPVADLEIKGEPEAVAEALARADHRVETARNAEREAGPRLSLIQDAETELEAMLAGSAGELARVEAVLGAERGRAEREHGLVTAAETHQKRFAELEQQVAGLSDLAPDMAAVEASLARAKSMDAAAHQERAKLREALAGLDALIRTRSDEAVEENWQEAIEARDVAEARVKAFETEVAVLSRIKTTLDMSRAAARDHYLQPVLGELQPLLRMLFDDVSIAFDDKTLLPQSIRRNGQDEDVDRLSGGMREQLSILTRLAFARLLARDGKAAPVILDDALVYSDDDRIEKMFDALHRQARDQQIIVFSCRQRAFSRLGGNVLQMMDWKPATS